MIKIKSGFAVLFAACLLSPCLLFAQPGTVKQIRLSRFGMQSSAVVTEPGELLSSAAYKPTGYWFPVTIPSTVLTGLVANHVYPDPYTGMNNMLIPDASDSFNTQYHLAQYSFLPHEANPWKKPYWYRTSFTVPAADRGRYFQLIFKGINYRAAVWLNGKEIADSSQMAGMFAEYALDVSNMIKAGAANVLAVKIYPLDYPGLPAHPQLNALGDFYANGGPTGDIGKNVTMLCSVGWDWIPAVRDRNMGIWQPVYLRTSGHTLIERPKIVTQLPKEGDTTLAAIFADLTLANHGDAAQKGDLKITISPENFKGSSMMVDRSVSLEAGEAKLLHLAPEDNIPGWHTAAAGISETIPQLLIHHPHLWWPNGYGRPNLYRIRLQYITGGRVSDDTSFLFGIRTVSSKAIQVNGWTRRDFYVNGRRIHLTGGAWVPDMMLNRDSTRYDDEIHLCRNANINLLRIWGGGITPPDVFFELADRYGMLVWQDFWVTGDTQGEFKGSSGWPLEGNVFIRNMTSTIYRIRNHASLLLWTGGNEGHARKELYDAMRDSVIAIDGTRPFIPSSSGFARMLPGWKGAWPDGQSSGVYSGGPYSWQDPAVYYQKVDAGKDWLFKDETGIPSQPPYATLPEIIPGLVPDSTLPYPLNNTWGYHDACSGNGKYDLYYKAMADRYGEPESMEDFSEKMQLVNANGYRGIFEAAGHKLNQTGGVMLWKLNAAFPSVIWQVYDWYLEPNAGYYFMQRACEPVHIQLNLDDSAVAVVNRSYIPASGLTAQMVVLDLQGKSLYHLSAKLNMGATDVQEIKSLSGILQKAAGISFVVLNLKNGAGKIISHNTYWMEPHHNFKALHRMSASTVKTTLLKASQSKTEHTWVLQFTNTTEQLAFFVNPRLMNGKDGEEILPAFWSDNYFSLAPHAAITVRVSCPAAKISTHPEILIKGWNVEENALSL